MKRILARTITSLATLFLLAAAPADAAARVQAMSDGEVAQLAGRLDNLPAGAAITNDELLLIIIIILLVALLL